MEGDNHSFSRTTAKEYGVKQAILLKYMVHRIRQSKSEREGKKWFYDSAGALAERFPYLGGKSTVANLLNDLVGKGILRKGRFNRKGYDKTTWYTIANQAVADQVGEKLVYFSPVEAQKHGSLEAVLLANLRYWIMKNREEKDPGYRWHRMSPYELAGILPFPKTSIGRAINSLVNKDVLRVKPVLGQNAQEYAFTREEDLRAPTESGASTMATGPETLQPNVRPNLEIARSPAVQEVRPNLEIVRPIPEMDRPKLENGRPKLETNTYYIEPLVETIGRDHYRPSPPSAPSTGAGAGPELEGKEAFNELVKENKAFINSIPQAGRQAVEEVAAHLVEAVVSKLSDEFLLSSKRQGGCTLCSLGPAAKMAG